MIKSLLLLALAFQASSSAAPRLTLSEAVDRYIALASDRSFSAEERQTRTDALIAGLPISKMEPLELFDLAYSGLATGTVAHDAVRSRLAAVKPKRPADREAIRLVRLSMLKPGDPEYAAARKEAFESGDLIDLSKRGNARAVLYSLFLASRQSRSSDASIFSQLPAVFEAIPVVPLRGTSFVSTLCQAASAPPTDEPTRKRLRTASVALLTRTLAARKPDDLDRDRVAYDLSLLTVSTAGKLVGAPAPTMAYLWSSQPGLRSLEDIKGKVVVLDFWATWCKPCVASFPHIRELVERYKDEPVVFLGVTAIQGYHMGPNGRVDTKGKPQEEFGLMPEFMKRKGMTWPVVFNKGGTFDPAFRVEGIPHLTVIDAKGIVRYSALRPEAPDFALKVDGLVAEAKAAK